MTLPHRFARFMLCGGKGWCGAMETNRNERLILFSDAVIAITITLLVLELRLPEPVEGLNDAGLWAALVGLGPQFQAYLVSFLVIALFWTGHRAKFEVILRSSAGLIWLNMLFLLGISWIPFATAVLAESGGRLATILYAALVAAVALVSAAMSVHALRAGLVDSSLSGIGAFRFARSSLATALFFLLSIPLALASTDAAQWFWLLLLPVRIVTDRA
jgi:uncharacterized membrane protein